MEHQFVVDRQLVERYLLEELTPEDAAEFEAHFFECSKCAEEVRRGVMLRANLKSTSSEESDSAE